MFIHSDEIFKRKKQRCPECKELITDVYIEQNPFPEFPCPSCNTLIDISVVKSVELPAKNERREERFNATLKVSYKSLNGYFTEYIKNIGKGGIFINTKKSHEINDIVDLSLEVPGLNKPLIIKGEIVHVKIHNVPDEDAGIGVKFIDIDPESRNKLINFIKNQNPFEILKKNHL